MGLIAPDAPSKLGSLGPLGRLAKQGAGLLLDLDGTLVDSESVHRDAYRRYFAERGWQVQDQVLVQFSGRRAPEVFATLAGPWSGEDPVELTEGVLDALAASRVAPAPVAGAVRLIEACTRTGLPVAVVTSARRWWARAALDQFAVGEDPMMVEGMRMVTSEDCECGKPDPQPYRLGRTCSVCGQRIWSLPRTPRPGLPPRERLASAMSSASRRASRHRCSSMQVPTRAHLTWSRLPGRSNS